LSETRAYGCHLNTLIPTAVKKIHAISKTNIYRNLSSQVKILTKTQRIMFFEVVRVPTVNSLQH